MRHNGEAALGHSDTSAEVEQRYVEQLRRMSGAERVQAAFTLSEQVKQRVWAAVRAAFPEASPPELRWRYAEQVYGPEIAERVKRWPR